MSLEYLDLYVFVDYNILTGDSVFGEYPSNLMTRKNVVVS